VLGRLAGAGRLSSMLLGLAQLGNGFDQPGELGHE
jgi:hypothetical protein